MMTSFLLKTCSPLGNRGVVIEAGGLSLFFLGASQLAISFSERKEKEKLLNSVPIVHIEFVFIEVFPGEPFHDSRDYSTTFTQSIYHFDISGSICYFGKIDIRFPELASSFTETKHLDSKSCSL